MKASSTAGGDVEHELNDEEIIGTEWTCSIRDCFVICRTATDALLIKRERHCNKQTKQQFKIIANRSFIYDQLIAIVNCNTRIIKKTARKFKGALLETKANSRDGFDKKTYENEIMNRWYSYLILKIALFKMHVFAQKSNI